MSTGLSFGGYKGIDISELNFDCNGCTTCVSPLKIPSAKIITAFTTVLLFVDI